MCKKQSSKIRFLVPRKEVQNTCFRSRYDISTLLVLSWCNEDAFMHVEGIFFSVLQKLISWIKLNISFCSGCVFYYAISRNRLSRDLQTSAAVEATRQGITCSPPSIVRIWPRGVQDGAVCVIPPSGWMDISNKLSGIARIPARENYHFHPPLADGHMHKNVLHQQR